MNLVSVVILTFNRRESVLTLLGQLDALDADSLETIVVDNGSEDETAAAVSARFPAVRLVALAENRGVGARNRGLELARGEIVLTLDDDMVDLSNEDLDILRQGFADDEHLGSVCLKVTWPGSDRVRDWVHRRPIDEADQRFDTYEITEGAVAWRRSALEEVGYYREDFFISHEGLDLAFRLLEADWRIVYDGRVSVGHAHAGGGRKSWRRYYYDTRNLFWIAVLHLPVRDAIPYLTRGLFAMLAYSVRDRFLLTWMRAIRDGLAGMKTLKRERRPLSDRTRAYMRECDRHRPGFWTLAVKRLRQKNFSLD